MSESECGQTLVEMSLVLPILLMGLALAIQLIFYCHNMIALQRMALVASSGLSIETYKDAPHYYWFHPLQGPVLQPRLRYESQGSRWRPFTGTSTTKTPGRIVLVRVQTDLLPGVGFMRWLPSVPQEASAEILLDPPRPEED